MEPTLTRQTPAQHIVWLDVVRLVAMFTVVCCHCTDPFNFYPGTSPDIVDIKFWGAVYGAALRPCVPLFVMITGALLLPVRGDASAFYKKRIPRVFFPFLIWSVIYNLFPWITGLLGVEPKVILDFFPYSGEEVMRQSLAVSLGYIAEMPFNFSLLDVHMWYIYLLIGLYLYLPIVISQHFFEYKEYSDEMIFPRFTRDSVPRYRLPIIELLTEILADEERLQNAINVA